MELGSISPERLAELRERELRRFAELRPRGEALLGAARKSMPNGVPMTWMAALYEHPPIVVERGSGATFTDVDGNEYVDFNLADTSMFTGYGIEAFARAVGERAAAGPQFLLPDRGRGDGCGGAGRGASGCRSGSSRSRRPRRTPRRSASPAP